MRRLLSLVPWLLAFCSLLVVARDTTYITSTGTEQGIPGWTIFYGNTTERYCSGDGYVQSVQTSSYYWYNFRGTNVTAYILQASDSAMLEVWIDDVFVERINPYNAAVTEPSSCVIQTWSSGMLNYTQHKITIYHNGNPPEVPTGSTYMRLQKFIATAPDSPTSVTTDDTQTALPTSVSTGGIIPVGTSSGTLIPTPTPTPTPAPAAKTSVGPIVGGVVGGILGLALIGGLIWAAFFRKTKPAPVVAPATNYSVGPASYGQQGPQFGQPAPAFTQGPIYNQGPVFNQGPAFNQAPGFNPGPGGMNLGPGGMGPQFTGSTTYNTPNGLTPMSEGLAPLLGPGAGGYPHQAPSNAGSPDIGRGSEAAFSIYTGYPEAQRGGDPPPFNPYGGSVGTGSVTSPSDEKNPNGPGAAPVGWPARQMTSSSSHLPESGYNFSAPPRPSSAAFSLSSEAQSRLTGPQLMTIQQMVERNVPAETLTAIVNSMLAEAESADAHPVPPLPGQAPPSYQYPQRL